MQSLLDIIVKGDMLHKTINMTDSKFGVQNFIGINYDGVNGIRINDVSRQQAHPRLGVCPSW